jgi:hypothetical protein
MRIRAAFALPVLLGTALLVAACSGGSSESDTTQAGGGGGSDQFQRLVAYAQCIRQHGVPNFPDPQQGPNGQGVMRVTPGDLGGASPAQLQKAQEACQSLAPSSAPGQQQQQNDQALQFAQCMRRHGVPDFPDPQQGQGGGIILGGGGANLNTPAAQQALQACQGIMQGLGGQAGSSGGQG